MYFAAVIQTIFMNNDPVKTQIEADDKKWEQSNLMLTICNGPREGGGFLVAPDAKVDDGLFHYMMIVNVSRLKMLRIVPEVMKGTHEKIQGGHARARARK